MTPVLLAAAPWELWIPFAVFFVAVAIALLGVLRSGDGPPSG